MQGNVLETGLASSSSTAESTLHLMVLPVRIRTHCGIGRFCFIFFERIFLILKVLWEGWRKQNARHGSQIYSVVRAPAGRQRQGR